MDIGTPNFKEQKFLKQHIIDTVERLIYCRTTGDFHHLFCQIMYKERADSFFDYGTMVREAVGSLNYNYKGKGYLFLPACRPGEQTTLSHYAYHTRMFCLNQEIYFHYRNE
ncbi:hypothetical protein PB1_12914 [Bacillus methanolicus PB1]|uniref:Uncharacterized protein n=1 Tax=Bacillus methanolicus PB1 TaxID=997296 RepID=I3DW38_BACMT|nr:hypothetical protein [Bacillus methanolicus]EIJ78459.1 hypothetical protein PB1_12914 [Bacillus methanolicus PB1]